MKTIIEMLNDPNELWLLENEFLNEIGEKPMTDNSKERLIEAIQAEKIFFWIAKMDGRPVGMCSVSPCFSTFACKSCGVFDDFYVEPHHRKQGVARLLAATTQKWCREKGYASIMVGCCKEDVGMYQTLGFDVELGTMLVHNL